MPYTDDAMISVLQKIDIAFQTRKPSDLSVNVQFDDINEQICYVMAIQLNYVMGTSAGLGVFYPAGRIELNRLLEKREALLREKRLLQYAQEQAENSRRSYWVSFFALVGSGIYLIVAAFVAIWTVYYPVRVDVITPITIPVNIREHEQCPIPDKEQERTPDQNHEHCCANET